MRYGQIQAMDVRAVEYLYLAQSRGRCGKAGSSNLTGKWHCSARFGIVPGRNLRRGGEYLVPRRLASFPWVSSDTASANSLDGRCSGVTNQKRLHAHTIPTRQ